MNLFELKGQWEDTPEHHKHIHELFTQLVNTDPALKAHRDWCEANFHGLGERSFGWVWKLICEVLPENPVLCEIGVLRGQIISLWKLLRPDAIVLGITPMDSSGGVWESDYESDIKNIHVLFKLEQPILYKGYSQDSDAITTAANMNGLNVLYVDGSHQYQDVISDLTNYVPMVKPGGFLVIDDACCDMKQPWGYFQGIQEVTDALLNYMDVVLYDWEFIGNCMHLRIYKKK